MDSEKIKVNFVAKLEDYKIEVLSLTKTYDKNFMCRYKYLDKHPKGYTGGCTSLEDIKGL